MTSYGPGPGGTPQGGQPEVPGGAPAPPAGAGQPNQYAPPPGYAPPPAYTPPPGGPPMGTTVTAPPPPRGRSPLLVIGIIVLALVLICGIGGALLVGGLINATQPVANAGDAFMAALRDGDYNRAYDMSAPALQQDAGDAEGLQAALGTKPVASWSFTSRNISNNQGSLEGTTTYTDGSTGTVTMALIQVGNDWKVSGVSLR